MILSNPSRPNARSVVVRTAPREPTASCSWPWSRRLAPRRWQRCRTGQQSNRAGRVASHALGEFGRRVSPSRDLLQLSHPLLGPADQRYVGGHRSDAPFAAPSLRRKHPLTTTIGPQAGAPAQGNNEPGVPVQQSARSAPMLYAKHQVEHDLADLFRGDCRLPPIPAEAQLARQPSPGRFATPRAATASRLRSSTRRPRRSPLHAIRESGGHDRGSGTADSAPELWLCKCRAGPARDWPVRWRADTVDPL